MSDVTKPAAVAAAAPALTRKDFVSDQDVRWCPGCGDYSILAQVQKVMPELGVPRDKIVFVSGIGCSSRFPYYMNTFGFHTIHGRAPAVASGLKMARPDLMVWVVTGDGDGLSIGGNHFIHVLRRNVGLKLLLFNNRIYGLTKGQYSPTSELGKKTKSTPFGSVDRPLNPVSLALGAEATFVARTTDVDPKHLQEVVRRAADHQGTAFVEIFQNCNIFNDGAFESITDKDLKLDAQLQMEHGKPLRFGKNREKGIVLRGIFPHVVEVGEGPGQVPEKDLLHHDEKADQPHLAFLLSRLEQPEFPVPMGVFRAVQRPAYEEGVHAQLRNARAKQGNVDMDALLNTGDTWTVGPDGQQQ
jgi:2-oxoglutarate ferredoxin oxidoreductase subunit beta